VSADKRLVLGVFLALFGLYALTASGLPDNPDAEVEFQTTSAVARTGWLALGGTPEAEAIIALEFDVSPGGAGREHERFSWFGPGQALAALPLYGAGALLARAFPAVEARHAATEDYGTYRSEYWAHLAVGLRNPLLGAATAALISRRAALAAALGHGLASFAWPQARSTLSDVQATAALTWACWGIIALCRGLARGEPPRAWPALAFGLGVGAAFLTRVATAPAIAVLLAVFACGPGRALARRRAWGMLAAALLPAAAGLASVLALNHARFGDALETGYGRAVFSGTFFAYPWWAGLAGLLVSPAKGLVWHAPGILLAGAGAWALWRRGERLVALLAIGVAAAVILPVTVLQTWHGAWTYGPRYVLPAMPMAWVAVAAALDRPAARSARRVLAGALVALGLATSLPGVLVDHMTHQDLAVDAARAAWPEVAGSSERERDDARFVNLQWDWRFAAPWAHWRILATRLRGGDDFDARDLFGVDADVELTLDHERERGWLHLAWVDLDLRLGGPGRWGALGCAGLALLGVWLARRGRAQVDRPLGR
jgi:hypothetical protein